MTSIVISLGVDDASESITVGRQAGDVYVLSVKPANPEALAGFGHPVHHLPADDPESIYLALRQLYESVKPSLIVAPTTKNLKDALSRLAGLYDLPMATEVYDVKVSGDVITYARGFLSGRAVAREEVRTPAILLLAPRKTPRTQPGNQKGVVYTIEPPKTSVRVVERKPKEKGGVNIEAAELIVSVGRGFKSKEDLKLAYELADVLGAQIGCSRPIAADLKWLSEDHWVGLSGHKVAPKLYIAVGISGAPQHLAGITDAKIVVAINNDKSAPIFKNCDYGVVADLYQFLPVLTRRLKERLGKK